MKYKINLFCYIIYSLTVVWLLFLQKDVCAQESPRALMITRDIGWIVDTLERKEYNLFPEYMYDDFEYAQFKDSAGTTYYEIYNDSGRIYRKHITKRVFKALKKSIKNNKKEYYKIVFDTIVSFCKKDRKNRKRFQRRKVNAEIKDIYGSLYKGLIFSINDSLCVLFKEKDGNIISLSDTALIVFQVNAVSEIKLERKSQFFRGMIKAVPISIVSGIVIYGLVSAWFFDMEAYHFLMLEVIPILSGGIIGATRKVEKQFFMNSDSGNYQNVLGELNKYSIIKAENSEERVEFGMQSINSNHIRKEPLFITYEQFKKNEKSFNFFKEFILFKKRKIE